jgi:hypothetical protein
MSGIQDKIGITLSSIRESIRAKFGDDGKTGKNFERLISNSEERIWYELTRIENAIRHIPGGGGGGGIPDAPKDSKAYNRKNGGWTETTKTSEFPDANTLALRDDEGRINAKSAVDAQHVVNLAQMQSTVEEINEAIDAESTERKGADTAEVSARNTAIAGAVSTHNGSDTAHSGIRQAISDEVTSRQEAIAQEKTDRNNAISAATSGLAPLASPGLTGNPTAPTQPINSGLKDESKTRIATVEYVDRAGSLTNFLKLTNTSVGVNIKKNDSTLINGTEIIFDLLYNETASGSLVTEAIIHGQLYISANGNDSRHGFVANTNRNINIYFYKDSDGCHNLYISKEGANDFPSIRAQVYGGLSNGLFKPLPLVITAVTTAPTGMTAITEYTR